MARKSRSAVQRVAAKVYWQEDDARVLVGALAESGDSLTGFAFRHGFDPKRLSRWRARLTRKDSETVEFHPVQLTMSELGRGSERGSIAIELSSGRRVHVGRGFDAEDLRLVVAILEDVAEC